MSETEQFNPFLPASIFIGFGAVSGFRALEILHREGAEFVVFFSLVCFILGAAYLSKWLEMKVSGDV